MKKKNKFQLHHTGIKTRVSDERTTPGCLFQLHHTGIKTESSGFSCIRHTHFNCTIQELKRIHEQGV